MSAISHERVDRRVSAPPLNAEPCPLGVSGAIAVDRGEALALSWRPELKQDAAGGALQRERQTDAARRLAGALAPAPPSRSASVARHRNGWVLPGRGFRPGPERQAFSLGGGRLQPAGALVRSLATLLLKSGYGVGPQGPSSAVCLVGSFQPRFIGLKVRQCRKTLNEGRVGVHPSTSSVPMTSGFRLEGPRGVAGRYKDVKGLTSRPPSPPHRNSVTQFYGAGSRDAVPVRRFCIGQKKSGQRKLPSNQKINHYDANPSPVIQPPAILHLARCSRVWSHPARSNRGAASGLNND